MFPFFGGVVGSSGLVVSVIPVSETGRRGFTLVSWVEAFDGILEQLFDDSSVVDRISFSSDFLR